MSTATTSQPLVEVTNIINDANGLARQRCVTIKVTGLDPANPEIKFTPGQLALVRIDSLLVIPYKSYSEGYWNGDKKSPTIHFDLFPDQDSFEVQVMVWGVQYG